MDRRRFLCGCSLLALSSLEALAEIRRLGFISSSTTTVDSPYLVALREGLKDRGYADGQNLAIDYQFAQSRDQLPGMAHKLVQKRVEVILAGGSEGIVAAKNATTTIPIVMTNSGDAVREGFAASLARPGGNITGMTQISPNLPESGWRCFWKSSRICNGSAFSGIQFTRIRRSRFRRPRGDRKARPLAALIRSQSFRGNREAIAKGCRAERPRFPRHPRPVHVTKPGTDRE